MNRSWSLTISRSDLSLIEALPIPSRHLKRYLLLKRRSISWRVRAWRSRNLFLSLTPLIFGTSSWRNCLPLLRTDLARTLYSARFCFNCWECPSQPMKGWKNSCQNRNKKKFSKSSCLWKSSSGGSLSLSSIKELNRIYHQMKSKRSEFSTKAWTSLGKRWISSTIICQDFQQDCLPRVELTHLKIIQHKCNQRPKRQLRPGQTS